jgi:cell pole-organizing protein PopZ
MNQARGAQEPTMEEILSSIRRIISEDGKRGGDLAEPSAPESPISESSISEAPISESPDPEPAPATALRAVPAVEPSADADDVLELTEIAPDEADEPEPLELVEEASAPALAEPEPAPAPTSRPLPESVTSPSPAASAPKAASPKMEPVPEPTPIPAAAPVPPPPRASLAPVPEPELEAVAQPEPEREPQPELEIRAETEPESDVEHNIEPLEISVSAPAPDAQPQLMRGSRLMSEATEIASSAALSVLAQVVQPGRGFTEEGRRMVDQIVRERLEVHLRDWMDTNLPPLVERNVCEEIAGMVERPLWRRS